ncbi:MAG TPA: hypothetical protein VGB87_01110 [Vicinamibacteria bacterium]
MNSAFSEPTPRGASSARQSRSVLRLFLGGIDGRLKPLRDLPEQGDRLVDRNGASTDSIGERRALDELEDERLPAVGLVEPVDLRDVGMVQRSEDLRFALEPREAVRGRRASGRTFRATSRPSFVSRAR